MVARGDARPWPGRWWPLLGWVLPLVLAGCSWSGPHTDKAEQACMSYRDVRGPTPDFGPRALTGFANDSAMCHGLWLPKANQWFVPQGLALDGRTAWVTGYRWRPMYGKRECRLLRVDLRSGKLLTYLPRITGAVEGRAPVYCRHGGGVALTRNGLWILETMRMWLLDPDKIGTAADPVTKVWRIDRPMKGSVLVDGRHLLGIGRFHAHSLGNVEWFRYDDLLASGVSEIARNGARRLPARVTAVNRTRAPQQLQGATIGRAGVWFTSSTTRCGVLHRPDGARLAFGPGAEDIEFDRDGNLWAVLESGTKQYQRTPGRPMVPMLARFNTDTLLRGTADDCS